MLNDRCVCVCVCVCVYGHSCMCVPVCVMLGAFGFACSLQTLAVHITGLIKKKKNRKNGEQLLSWCAIPIWPTDGPWILSCQVWWSSFNWNISLTQRTWLRCVILWLIKYNQSNTCRLMALTGSCLCNLSSDYILKFCGDNWLIRHMHVLIRPRLSPNMSTACSRKTSRSETVAICYKIVCGTGSVIM